jgi:hypothetical protein
VLPHHIEPELPGETLLRRTLPDGGIDPRLSLIRASLFTKKRPQMSVIGDQNSPT